MWRSSARRHGRAAAAVEVAERALPQQRTSLEQYFPRFSSTDTKTRCSSRPWVWRPTRYAACRSPMSPRGPRAGAAQRGGAGPAAPFRFSRRRRSTAGGCGCWARAGRHFAAGERTVGRWVSSPLAPLSGLRRRGALGNTAMLAMPLAHRLASPADGLWVDRGRRYGAGRLGGDRARVVVAATGGGARRGDGERFRGACATDRRRRPGARRRAVS